MGGRGPNNKRVWCGQVQQIAEAEEALMTSCSDGVDERALVTPDDLSLGDACYDTPRVPAMTRLECPGDPRQPQPR